MLFNKSKTIIVLMQQIYFLCLVPSNYINKTTPAMQMVCFAIFFFSLTYSWGWCYIFIFGVILFYFALEESLIKKENIRAN